MKPDRTALGFCELTAYNALATKLTLKLFISFIATKLSHYPFMPIKFFEKVFWPVQDTILVPENSTAY